MSGREQESLAQLELTQPKRITLNDQVYNELRRLIMSGRLRPGQIVSIRAIANVINISPMPVRGALQRLVAEGALDMQQNRTFAIPVQSPESFREITDLRVMLEGKATERAVKLLNKGDVAFLIDINRKMFHGSELDLQEYLELNQLFHFRIYQAAGMPRLLRFIESLWLQIGPLLNLVTTREEMPFGRETHEAIVQAIATDDADRAKAAVEYDILDAARSILEHLKDKDFEDTGTPRASEVGPPSETIWRPS